MAVRESKNRFNRPKDYEILLRGYITNRYRFDLIHSSARINHIHIHLDALTTSAYSYFEYIRVMSRLFQVQVCRNEFDINEGIWIVGRSTVLINFQHYFQMGICKIEENVDRYQAYYKGGFNEVQEAVARYRKENLDIWLRKWILPINRLELITTFAGDTKAFEIQNQETYNAILYGTYINDTSVLRTKKLFKWNTTA